MSGTFSMFTAVGIATGTPAAYRSSRQKQISPLIKGSIASAEAVAQDYDAKVRDGRAAVPAGAGVEPEWYSALSRQTMSNWLIKCTEDYLVPIYDRLHKQLLAA